MEQDPDVLLNGAMDEMDKGHYKEAEALANIFLNHIPRHQKTEARMMKYNLLSARLQVRLTHHNEAIHHCMEAMARAKAMGDPVAVAMTLRWLAHIHWRAADYDMALEYIAQGSKLAREAKAKDVEGTLFIEKGNVLANLGDTDGAGESYQAAIALLGPLGPSRELTRALNNLGDNYLRRTDYGTALGLFEKTKTAALDDINLRGWACVNMADCLQNLERLEEAQKEVDEALLLFTRSADPLGIAVTHWVQGVIDAKGKNWEKAESNLNYARGIAKDIGMPVLEGKVVRDIGRMYGWKGDKAQARQYLSIALGTFKEHHVSAFQKLTELDIMSL